MSKLFSSVLDERLTKYMDVNEFILNKQNGFTKLRSCTDHLLVLYAIIRNRMAKVLPMYACFVDMMRAFNR